MKSRHIFSSGAVIAALVSPGIYRIEGQGSASVLTEGGHLCVEPVTHLLLLPSGSPEGVPGIPREALEAILQDFYGTPEPGDAPAALSVPAKKLTKKELAAAAALITPALASAGLVPVNSEAAGPGLTLDKVVLADALISEAQAAAAAAEPGAAARQASFMADMEAHAAEVGAAAPALSVDEITSSASDPGWPDEDEDLPLSTEVTDREGGE